MLKNLSTLKLQLILIAIAIFTTNYAAIASGERDTEQRNRPTANSSSVTPDTQKSVELLKAEVEPVSERVRQAASAEEIEPGDWAYKSLAALNAKYKCGILPTGEESISRGDFATNLNSCIKSMEKLVARKNRKRPVRRKPVVTTPAEVVPAVPPVVPVEPVAPEVVPTQPTVAPPPENTVSQQDLEELKDLITAFRAELGGLDLKYELIDSKLTALRNNSFSTTTKLQGEVIFAVTGLSGGPATAQRNTILSDRVRLNFRSSFTGKDLLWARLQSINSNTFANTPSGTNMTRLGFEGNGDNTSVLQKLQYRFPVTAQTTLFLEATGAEFNDNVYNFNPELQSAGTGSITRFGRFNPVYRLSGTGAGVTIDHKFDSNFGVVLGYVVPQEAIAPSTVVTDAAANPARGLFNGSNTIFSQLSFKPGEDANLGLIYARTYSSGGGGVSGNTGSAIANNPFSGAPTSANHYSLLASFNLSKNLILSGWGGLTQANREGAAGKADLWNYALTLAVKDAGAPGNLLGFVVGVPPKLTSNSGATATRVDRDTSLHLEAFYRYRINDNLSITPGILVLTNPEHNSAIPTEYLGTIRTTFSF
jgi:hypothetical protein